jgi:peptidoglycan/LPS O-acetylase OafA/YrhL
MKYIKQLDSLRAIAVTFVVIGHYFPSFYIWKYFPIGSFGVDLFFVLSGFLITNILISQRDLNDSFKSTKMRLILNFYIRRILRIFPIYYLFVIFIYLFSSIVKTNVDSAFPYLLTYTVNIYFLKNKDFQEKYRIYGLWQ